MPPPISDDLRQRIIAWREEGIPVKSIAELAGCKDRVVYKILATHRDTGGVRYPPSFRPRGRPRTLDNHDIDYISGLLAANPTLYLDEIQEKLASARGVDVSISTVSRTLNRLALSNKQVSKVAVERNEVLRATWVAAYGHIPKEYFVFLDESSVDDVTGQRQKGWSQIGRACVRRATFLRGQRYSILPALTVDGLIALDIFEGSVNKEKFIHWISTELAPLLNPYPGPRSVVVLDNCAIHHDAEIRRIIVDECGAQLIYLPPYSPDMNPIEQAFHTIKSWLRRNENRVARPEQRPWMIHQASLSVTPEKAVGYMINCGYS